MSFFFEQPRQSRLETHAGGVAGVGDLMRAAYDATLLADNTNSHYFAIDRAYERRIATVREATGRVLENPLKRTDALWREQEIARPQSPFATLRRTEKRSYAQIALEAEAEFSRQLDDAFADRPQDKARLGLDKSVEDEAREFARGASEQLDRLAATRSGAGKWFGILAGSAGASLRDPLQIAMLAAGGGPGAGRTIAARIVNVAMKEALVNAGAEAVIQPAIQDWRARAGLPAGFEEGLRNVLFAGAIGGAFGGVIGAFGEAISAAARRANAPVAGAADATAPAPPRIDGAAPTPMRAETPAGAVPAPAAGARAELPPVARGALDHAEALAHAETLRPAGVTPQIHDAALSRALDAAQGGPVRPLTDTAQAERIALALEPDIKVKAARAPKQATLTDFLIAKGGIADQGGEVLAVTGGQIARRGKGSLVREDGLKLDSARELAAQNGYLDRLYGNPDEATARSTIADFLSLLDEDLRAGGVLPGFAERQDDVAAGLALSRGRIADDVLALQRAVGPGIDDATIIRALNIARDEGIDPLDAFERAAMEAPDPDARPQRSGETLPGWSDEELLAASGERQADILPDGVDDPGRPPDWLQEGIDDLPDELDALDGDDLLYLDDGAMSAADLRDRLKRDADEIALVEACRA